MVKSAEMISLILTVLTLQMCLEVVFVWWKEAWTFLHGNRRPWIWAGFAITLHFAASFVDNFYWGGAWSLSFADSEHTEKAMQYGVFSNIPFRQIGTSLAAFCYLKAGCLFQHKNMNNIYMRMMLSVFLGILYVAWLAK